MHRPRIYIDTEFTDFLDMDLVSIALVCGADHFYAERSDYNASLCAEFTRKTVLPQLGNVPADSYRTIASNVQAWLQRYATSGPVLCYDSIADFVLLQELLAGTMPSWLDIQNIRDSRVESARLAYFHTTGNREHHALHDALANQQAHTAFRRKQGYAD